VAPQFISASLATMPDYATMVRAGVRDRQVSGPVLTAFANVSLGVIGIPDASASDTLQYLSDGRSFDLTLSMLAAQRVPYREHGAWAPLPVHDGPSSPGALHGSNSRCHWHRIEGLRRLYRGEVPVTFAPTESCMLAALSPTMR